MNLTGRPVTPKGAKRKLRLCKQPNAEEKKHMARVGALPCIVGPLGCLYRGLPSTIHHCGTRRGGRKNHFKVIPLCWEHHLGKKGVDGKKMSFAEWQSEFGTEDALLKKVERKLENVT